MTATKRRDEIAALATARAEFYGHLFATVPHGWANVFSTGGGSLVRASDPEGIAKSAGDLNANGADVWVAPGVTTERPDDFRGKVKLDHVGLVPALWVDIDAQDKTQRGLSIGGAHVLLAMGSTKFGQPSLVVESGYGLHGYWLLDEPLAADEATQLMARWKTHWVAQRPHGGYAVDPSVFEVSRVLRAPWTYNYRYPERPVMATCTITDEPVRYSAAELASALPEVEVRQRVRYSSDMADAVLIDRDSKTTRLGHRALTTGCRKIAGTQEGGRNNALYMETKDIAKGIRSGEINYDHAVTSLVAAADVCGLDYSECYKTMMSAFRDSGITKENQ